MFHGWHAPQWVSTVTPHGSAVSNLSFTLTADTTGRDNCGIPQARQHSPCGLTLSMKNFQP